MKRKLLAMALSALLLAGCGVRETGGMTRAATGSTEQSATEAARTTLPTTEPAAETTQPAPAPTETVPPTQPDNAWEIGVPQSGEPISPQPGDTASTWDMDRAGDYPADEDCSDGELLEKWMAVEGVTQEDLDNRGCNQLVLVVAKGTADAATTTVCYERVDGEWQNVSQFSRMSGWTGANGIAHNRQRNTVTSPAGLWGLGTAFGNEEKPDGLLLPWRDVTPDSDWVCDANSIYFNTWQERDDPELADSWDYDEGEHLADFPNSYAYACVIRYNTPPYTIPNRGCAIFFHCAKDATGGCIGLLREDFVNVLCWLNPEERLHILITGRAMA